MSCTRATNATWDRILTVGITTLAIRLIEPRLQTMSFSSTAWEVAKTLIKNDENALPDAIKAVRCWLGI